MAIPLIGTGGLFTRIGKILYAIGYVNTFRGTTIPTQILDIFNQYLSTDEQVTNNIFTVQNSYQNSSTGYLSQLQQIASATIIAMVADDAPQPNTTLSNALTYLITQMVNTNQSVLRCIVSSSVAYGGSNQGNPIVLISTLSNLALPLEYIYNEVISGIVTNDSVSNNATPGLESFRLTSPIRVGQRLSWLWPVESGSGLNTGLTCISALTQGAGGQRNWIRNGNMETWTVPNVPNNWNVNVGTPGTQILQSTAGGTYYDGLSSVEFVGDSSTLTNISQLLGSPNTPSSPTQYSILAFDLKIKANSTPASGVIQVSLCNSGGTVIQDNLGNNNQVNTNLSTLTSTFSDISGFFRLPRVLPVTPAGVTDVNFRICLTSPCPSGNSLFIDHAALATPSQLYSSGPYVSIFSGNQNLIDGDTITLTINNNYVTGGQMQTGFNRLFNMSNGSISNNNGGLNMVLPSLASGNTISDGLIN